MASKKKPAKPIAGQSKATTQDPAVYGLQVRFMGFSGAASECCVCKRITVRGMIRIKQDMHYCSIRCATAPVLHDGQSGDIASTGDGR